MYRVVLNEEEGYNRIAFVFKEFDEAMDFITLAMGRSVKELEVTISELKEANNESV